MTAQEFIDYIIEHKAQDAEIIIEDEERQLFQDGQYLPNLSDVFKERGIVRIRIDEFNILHKAKV